ncbi:50S ribosomal protein L15 [Candidatus Marinamargulisbacteria bacterium SCGC AAA071-K20]|nr:50S ribosomal protein L15 [Candidatus Marinamargulisbacteria bacterium SCGC AAA071-K20]
MMSAEIKPNKKAIKKTKRKGRGNASGLGGECGRGHKGQKSRSGFKSRPGFEGGQMPLYRRIPKKRGIQRIIRTEFQAINLTTLENFFSSGETVNPETLYEKGLIKKRESYKILANGMLTKKLAILTFKISKSAITKLEKSSSTYELIN